MIPLYPRLRNASDRSPTLLVQTQLHLLSRLVLLFQLITATLRPVSVLGALGRTETTQHNVLGIQRQAS